MTRTIEKQRTAQGSLAEPLLYQWAKLYSLSIRDFAAVFGISRGHAEDVLKHRRMPSLELAFRIARYFEVRVDELFGWMIDDTGERCSLLLDLPTGVMRVNSRNIDEAREIMWAMLEECKNGASKIHGVRSSRAAGIDEGIHRQGQVGSEGQGDDHERQQEDEAVPGSCHLDGY
jgi:transcriptional regulator with XRE-family HTH domain